MALVTYPTIPIKAEKITSTNGSDLRQLEIQFNELLQLVYRLGECAAGDGVISPCTLSTGTTNTLATASGIITIGGTPAAYTGIAAQAFGALGTIPALKWGCIGVDAVAAGTTTFVSAAANYTTGYSTEAAAIAAAPAKTANKARIGYVLVQASASTWIAGTDGLTLGSGGNVAAATNFYSVASPLQLTAPSANAKLLGCGGWTAYEIGKLDGVTVLSSDHY